MLERHKELDHDAEAKKMPNKFRQTVGDGKERRNRAIERMEQKLEKLSGFLKDAKPRMGLSGEEAQSNITDNQSALIKSPHGYIQEYNGGGFRQQNHHFRGSNRQRVQEREIPRHVGQARGKHADAYRKGKTVGKTVSGHGYRIFHRIQFAGSGGARHKSTVPRPAVPSARPAFHGKEGAKGAPEKKVHGGRLHL
jgi:hypothetical protein